MARERGSNPHLAFAHRHSKSLLSTLNAFASLSRIRDLLSDLDELEAAIRTHESAGQSKGRRPSWFEITSYYPVGFVTCLEWHARSRLIDLLTFSPSAIRLDDLKGHINDKVLVQTVAEGVTVPQMVGAMTTIGSSQRYISIFDRIFSELKIAASVRDIISPIILKKEGGRSYDELQQIFDYRNILVHEIDFSTIGPWLVRSSIDIAEARSMGATVLAVMETIETQFTRSLPQEFPNRLDTQLLPEDDLEYLDVQIVKLKDEIAAAISVYRADAGKSDCADEWLDVLSASRTYQQKELDFISSADLIHNRHFDFRRPLKDCAASTADRIS